MVVVDHSDRKKTCEDFCRLLTERQHVEVPFPLSQEDFNEAAKHFFDFLALPQERKDQFYVRPTDDPRDSGVGYVRKKQEDGEYDNKEYFHYHPSTEKKYFNAMMTGDDMKVQAFFDAARAIFQESKRTLSSIVSILGEPYPKTRLHLSLSEEWGGVLRFLKYDVAGKGKFLAAGHYDKGACTLALAESAPGLRLGRNNETLVPVTRTGNSAFFMLGLNFGPLTDHAFSPTWHDVVQESEDTYDDETARWAIVFFVGAKDLPYPSLEATHAPLS